MKKIRKLSYWLVLILMLVACKETPKKSNGQITSETVLVQTNDTLCAAPVAWFNGAVPTPNPNVFPQGDVTNCDFHLVSWNYFLWLTEEVNGELRFETMYTNKAIYPEFKDDTYHVLDIVEQALSKGMLVDQNGRAVYSSIIINDVYRDFVLDNQLYDPEVLLNFDPNTNFPVGSIALKTSWKIVQPNEDVSKLYTKKADIELLDLVDGLPRIDKNNPNVEKDVEVALVALHVSVVVEGHPEFIWATFEFDDNAPDFAENQNPDAAVSVADWMFYAASTPARKTNADNATTLKFSNQEKQLLAPITQVARQYVNGGGSTTNQENITHLNKSVKSQLPSASVWKNYFEVGAIWFNTSKGSLKPDWNPNVDPSMVTGSLKLSNATIETFTQKVRSQNECFSCHNTNALTSVPTDMKILGGKNVNISHILLKNYIGGKEIPLQN
ncbi:hypothetical protein [Ulvibacter litoralis]|uniref:Cytochrome P460 n=1 Tax=Ulvibacter litoralis TaxID=227084 RepID=A0A1G7HH16_9FLAO|nr:hypothetical protein [Ulvibacter litoralis]SDE99651.1 hypothetical protein SAMN05421855_10488 [Ulvibacter litoralis]